MSDEGDEKPCPNCDKNMVANEWGRFSCQCGFKQKYFIIPLKELDKVVEQFTLPDTGDNLFSPDYYGDGVVIVRGISAMFKHINANRKVEGKGMIEDNSYIVCNTDEPYAKKVLSIILDGEGADQ